MSRDISARSCRRTLALAIVGLVWLGAGQGCSTKVEGPATPVAGSTTSELRDAAVRVAERTAVVLTSLDQRDPDGGYDRLLALLTGPARQEWEQRRVGYLTKIKSEGVTADGTVKASGVADLDPRVTTATVLVAATAMVATKQNPTAEKRRYRLRMELIRTGGEWKVSQLQLVS
jgi:Mce-associated membrane protein